MVSHSIVGTRSPPICIWLANLSLHHKHVHGLSRFLSGHLSIAHALPRFPTHIVPSRSRGDLSITNTPSLPPHASMPSMCPSRPFFLVGQTSIGHVLQGCLSLLQTITHWLSSCISSPRFSISEMHAWYVHIRNENTHSLSNLSYVVTFSFTHILFLHTYSFSFTCTWSVSTKALSSVHSI